MPLTGGLVIACNHFRWVDPPALGAASPRTIYFMAKVEAHRVPGLGAFIRAFGTFPVRRGESDRDAVRTMRRSCATVSRSASSSRDPAELRRSRRAAARGRDGRAPGGRPGDPGRDPRLADVEAGNSTRSRSPGVSRSDFDGLPKGGKGYKEASAVAAGEDQRALRLPRRDARARSAGRASAAMSGDESRSRRRSRRRARSRAPSRSSASRTSASRR